MKILTGTYYTKKNNYCSPPLDSRNVKIKNQNQGELFILSPIFIKKNMVPILPQEIVPYL